MIISQELKKTNIAEYILYMWQTEDIIRSFNFDIELIKKNIVDQYQISDEIKLQIENWYKNIILMMELENVEKSGHIQILKNIIIDLNDLNLRLLQMKEQFAYQKAFAYSKPHIDLLKQKISDSQINDIDICFHGLYGILLLKIKKINISAETQNSVDAIKEMVSILAARYKEREENPDKFYE